MMRFPFWFADAWIESRKAHPLPPAEKSAEADTNSFDRVLWEIGVVLAVALCAAAFVQVALRANGIG